MGNHRRVGGTGTLPPGGEKSFTMNTVGQTRIHCTIHPQMTGTLIVASVPGR